MLPKKKKYRSPFMVSSKLAKFVGTPRLSYVVKSKGKPLSTAGRSVADAVVTGFVGSSDLSFHLVNPVNLLIGSDISVAQAASVSLGTLPVGSTNSKGEGSALGVSVGSAMEKNSSLAFKARALSQSPTKGSMLGDPLSPRLSGKEVLQTAEGKFSPLVGAAANSDVPTESGMAPVVPASLGSPVKNYASLFKSKAKG